MSTQSLSLSRHSRCIEVDVTDPDLSEFLAPTKLSALTSVEFQEE